jgi:hypothetical protein
MKSHLLVWIAALLGGASVASGQDATRRKLATPRTIDGVSCAATGRAYADFFPSGRLKSCPIAHDTVIGGHALRVGTWITLDEAGLLRAAWLSHDTPLAGHLCKGTGYKGFSVRFRPDETLELCFLARDTVIDGVPCLHGSFVTELRGGGRTIAYFHEDGSLASCQASRAFTVTGTQFRKWDRVNRQRTGTITR